MTIYCPSGKHAYRDRIAADLALAGVRRTGSGSHDEQRSYPCNLCRGWHLTSQPKRQNGDT